MTINTSIPFVVGYTVNLQIAVILLVSMNIEHGFIFFLLCHLRWMNMVILFVSVRRLYNYEFKVKIVKMDPESVKWKRIENNNFKTKKNCKELRV